MRGPCLWLVIAIFVALSGTTADAQSPSQATNPYDDHATDPYYRGTPASDQFGQKQCCPELDGFATRRSLRQTQAVSQPGSLLNSELGGLLIAGTCALAAIGVAARRGERSSGS